MSELKKIRTLLSIEYYKLHKYINTIADIPFNNYITNDFGNTKKYINNCYKILNDTIYGHKEVKLHILQIVSHFIKNQFEVGNVLWNLVHPEQGKRLS